ncbi:hypothetical protein KEM60_00654 [Austwickia sp. TVS 96-490-7B]|nr:hypothetical protein [Austwickia sp. TVS 96-490-7B]
MADDGPAGQLRKPTSSQPSFHLLGRGIVDREGTWTFGAVGAHPEILRNLTGKDTPRSSHAPLQALPVGQDDGVTATNHQAAYGGNHTRPSGPGWTS